MNYTQMVGATPFSPGPPDGGMEYKVLHVPLDIVYSGYSGVPDPVPESKARPIAIDKLNALVNDHIKAGWRPVGAVVIDGKGGYHQTMVGGD